LMALSGPVSCTDTVIADTKKSLSRLFFYPCDNEVSSVIPD
jgi:hypothetical protein